jgi:enamine deaminase RidA (YjgF/YER057c/UK114 family)
MVDPTLIKQAGAEERLANLGIQLPGVPSPMGSYVEAVQTGSLLFLSGMLPVIDHKPAYVGRIGRELDANTGREAARVAALNGLAALKDHLGSLDRVRRVIRLGVFMATAEDFSADPGVADGASDLLRDVFGEDKMPVRSVIGVASLPLGVPVELEATFEIQE